MKTKTARRFLSRNQTKMAKHEFNHKIASPSFLKKWKKCVEVVIRSL